jgi:curved DNA-binding protein CbpA
MKITTTEQRRLDLFEAGHSIEDIAAAEGATIQSIKTSIWRAKAKREGTYKAPAASTGSSKKKSGFNFKAEDMEKVNFIKESFKNKYGAEMTTEELIERALRSLYAETYEYEKIQKQQKEKAEREERERQERAKQERRNQEKKRKARRTFGKMKLQYFTGFEETTQDIKKIYRKFSKMYHPDVQGTGDAEKFKQLHNEYEYMMAK